MDTSHSSHVELAHPASEMGEGCESGEDRVAARVQVMHKLPEMNEAREYHVVSAPTSGGVCVPCIQCNGATKDESEPVISDEYPGEKEPTKYDVPKEINANDAPFRVSFSKPLRASSLLLEETSRSDFWKARLGASTSSVHRAGEATPSALRVQDTRSNESVKNVGSVSDGRATVAKKMPLDAYKGNWMTEYGCFTVSETNGSWEYLQEANKEIYIATLEEASGSLYGRVSVKLGKTVVANILGNVRLWFEDDEVLYSSFTPKTSSSSVSRASKLVKKNRVQCYLRCDLSGDWYSHAGVITINVQPESAGITLSFTQKTEYGVASASLHPRLVSNSIVYTGYANFADASIGTLTLKFHGDTMMCMYTGEDRKVIPYLCRRCDEDNEVFVSLASLKNPKGTSLWQWVREEEITLPPVPKRVREWIDEYDHSTGLGESGHATVPKVPIARRLSSPMSLSDQLRWLSTCLQGYVYDAHERRASGSAASRSARESPLTGHDAVQQLYEDIKCLISNDTSSKVERCASSGSARVDPESQWPPIESFGAVPSLPAAKSQGRSSEAMLTSECLPDVHSNITADSWGGADEKPGLDLFYGNDDWHAMRQKSRFLIIKLVWRIIGFVRRRYERAMVSEECSTKKSSTELLEIMPPPWSKESVSALDISRHDVDAGCVAVFNTSWCYLSLRVAAMIVHPTTKKILMEHIGFSRRTQEARSLGQTWNDMLPTVTVDLDHLSIDNAAHYLVTKVLNLNADPSNSVYQVISSVSPDNILLFVIHFELKDNLAGEFVECTMPKESEYSKKRLRWVNEREWIATVKEESVTPLLDAVIMVPWLVHSLPDQVIAHADTMKKLQTGQIRFFRRPNGTLLLGEDYVYLDLRTPDAYLRSVTGSCPGLKLRPYETVRQCVARIVHALGIKEKLTLSNKTIVTRYMSPPLRPSNLRVHTAEHWVTLNCAIRFGTRVVFPGGPDRLSPPRADD
eukprot:GEMP01007274.1.p1 GENE.GEMP01007274.1~~GEMP01007274.1.p1  ORF type:complete len:972 (+),score=189.31 GEMP01007274.1:481-3396(+)